LRNLTLQNGGKDLPPQKTNFMATLEVKGDRNIIKGKLKQMKAKLTDDKLQYVEGKSEELLGKLQKHTGEIHEAVKESAAGRCEYPTFPGCECANLKQLHMKDHVYKLIELTGTSTTPLRTPWIRPSNARTKPSRTCAGFRWSKRAATLTKGKVHHWQVTIKVGFTVED
jgi:flavin-binding protein dodecin/uncharacterized protein YjbJ (UPF0337 family)